jgi:multidrug resistance efflux pump
MAAADLVTRQDADQAATAASVAQGEQRQAAAGLGAAQARQKLAAYEVEVRTVRTPITGTIVRRVARAGTAVAAAAQLFLIEPEGGRVVRAELDESFAERVMPGMRAVVSREFQTGANYEARVLRVSDVLAGPSLAEEAAVRADARVVSVILSLPPGADLRLGQRVLVRFMP